MRPALPLPRARPWSLSCGVTSPVPDPDTMYEKDSGHGAWQSRFQSFFFTDRRHRQRGGKPLVLTDKAFVGLPGLDHALDGLQVPVAALSHAWPVRGVSRSAPLWSISAGVWSLAFLPVSLSATMFWGPTPSSFYSRGYWAGSPHFPLSVRRRCLCYDAVLWAQLRFMSVAASFLARVPSVLASKSSHGSHGDAKHLVIRKRTRRTKYGFESNSLRGLDF